MAVERGEGDGSLHKHGGLEWLFEVKTLSLLLISFCTLFPERRGLILAVNGGTIGKNAVEHSGYAWRPELRKYLFIFIIPLKWLAVRSTVS